MNVAIKKRISKNCVTQISLARGSGFDDVCAVLCGVHVQQSKGSGQRSHLPSLQLASHKPHSSVLTSAASLFWVRNLRNTAEGHFSYEDFS